MEYTKGEWEYDGKSIICNNKMLAVLGKVGQITSDEDDANANLIASAPIMHGQLDTGKNALTEALNAINNKQIDEAVDYIKGVIAGNEMAIDKAEGK